RFFLRSAAVEETERVGRIVLRIRPPKEICLFDVVRLGASAREEVEVGSDRSRLISSIAPFGEPERFLADGRAAGEHVLELVRAASGCARPMGVRMDADRIDSVPP